MHFDVGGGNVSELCDMEGNFCVENVLANGNYEETCKCFPACNEVSYSYRHTFFDLDSNEFCNPGIVAILKLRTLDGTRLL